MKRWIWALRIIGITMFLIAMFLMARMQQFVAERQQASESAPAP